MTIEQAIDIIERVDICCNQAETARDMAIAALREKEERDSRALDLPCNVGDIVYVDVRTLPYHYLHPLDGAEDFARCRVISLVITAKGLFMKLEALYPSRAGRRGYLRYHIGAIGRTIFLTREEAEKALAKEAESYE